MKRKNIVAKTLPYVAIGTIFLLLAIVMIALSHGLPATATVGRGQAAMSTGSQHTGVPQPTPTSVSTPAETPYPKPSYTPAIRPYETNTISGFILPSDPSSYVTPQNGWVKYYASQLYVDADGRIRYKNKKVPWAADPNGNTIMWMDEPFLNNYTFDIYKELFGYYDINNVPWLTPDFYLTHGQRGVCSAWAVTVTSMMLSGEMSLKSDDSKFVKQVIPAKIMIGKMQDKYDAWVEYSVYSRTFITSTARETEAITGEQHSQTWFLDKNNDPLAKLYTPYFEFTDKYFKEV